MQLTEKSDTETRDVDGCEFVVEDDRAEEDGGDLFEDTGDGSGVVLLLFRRPTKEMGRDVNETAWN